MECLLSIQPLEQVGNAGWAQVQNQRTATLTWTVVLEKQKDVGQLTVLELMVFVGPPTTQGRWRSTTTTSICSCGYVMVDDEEGNFRGLEGLLCTVSARWIPDEYHGVSDTEVMYPQFRRVEMMRWVPTSRRKKKWKILLVHMLSKSCRRPYWTLLDCCDGEKSFSLLTDLWSEGWVVDRVVVLSSNDHCITPISPTSDLALIFSLFRTVNCFTR